MAIDLRAILDAVESHAAATGRFDIIHRFQPINAPSYEPQNRPGYGLTCAVWAGRVAAVGKWSGLAETAVRLDVKVRLYRAATAAPLDAIDPDMVDALSDLWTAYNGDFTLGGAVTAVDVLGSAGAPLSADDGYLEEDEQVFRMYTINLPLILGHAFAQAP